MLSKLVNSPSCWRLTSESTGPPSFLHSMVKGRSPFVTRHCTPARLPRCRSVWKANGEIFGGTVTQRSCRARCEQTYRLWTACLIVHLLYVFWWRVYFSSHKRKLRETLEDNVYRIHAIGPQDTFYLSLENRAQSCRVSNCNRVLQYDKQKFCTVLLFCKFHICGSKLQMWIENFVL
jgi:hypothetical protein